MLIFLRIVLCSVVTGCYFSCRSEMPVFYSVVARGTVVLCDYASRSGNFERVTLSLLSNVPRHNTKISYSADQYMVHVLVEIPFTYLCIADEYFSKERAYQFLLEIKRRFCAGSIYQRAQNARAYELRREFSLVLKNEMDYISSSRIAQLEGEVTEVKGIMTENIEKVLQRGEHLDILQERSSLLENSASVFKVQSTRLQRKMWWQNVKLWILLLVIILVILTAIIIAIVVATRKNDQKN